MNRTGNSLSFFIFYADHTQSDPKNMKGVNLQ